MTHYPFVESLLSLVPRRALDWSVAFTVAAVTFVGGNVLLPLPARPRPISARLSPVAAPVAAPPVVEAAVKADTVTVNVASVPPDLDGADEGVKKAVAKQKKRSARARAAAASSLVVPTENAASAAQAPEQTPDPPAPPPAAPAPSPDPEPSLPTPTD